MDAEEEELGLVVTPGGADTVYSGGVDSGTTVIGGTEVVSSGATATSMTISSGGNAYVYGSASATTVMSNGAEYINSGATLTNATLSGGSITVSSGATVSGTITFVNSGTLVLDQSSAFSSGSLLAGFTAASDVLDLVDISFAANPTIGFVEAGNNQSGTLTVTDGTHSASLLLIGTYTAASFTSASDHNGGTLIADPPIFGTQAITNSQV